MPVTTGSYSNVESQIYDYVVNKLKFNTAIACGILANVEAESSFNPRAVGDGGSAYGLFQWNSRRKQLFNYTGSNNPSVYKQLEFLKYELYGSESSSRKFIEKQPNNAQGAYDAAYYFCTKFERPSNAESKGRSRGSIARDKYWAYYSKNPVGSSNLVQDKGQEIIEVAKSLLDTPYVVGGDTTEGLDSTGFIRYTYSKVGVPIPDISVKDYYEEYSDSKSVDVSQVAAGDLLLYSNNYIAIADGKGGRYYTNELVGEVIYSSILGKPSSILRILSESETTQDTSVVDSGVGSYEYTGLTSIDPYSSIMNQNLSGVQAEGYDYSYLIDMTNGGEFRFYTPEFSEQAGANWSPVEIRGRSSAVLAYDHTSSRVITVSLELYAGVGLYKATSGESGSDTVSRLHRDAFFVKSLEYPDYSYAITQPPATVHLILGAAIDIIGVVSGVTVEHLKPVDSTNRSMYIKLNFTVTQTAVNPIDYKDVRSGKYALTSTSDIDSLLLGGSTVEDTSNATNTPNYTKKTDPYAFRTNRLEDR